MTNGLGRQILDVSSGFHTKWQILDDFKFLFLFLFSFQVSFSFFFFFVGCVDRLQPRTWRMCVSLGEVKDVIEEVATCASLLGAHRLAMTRVVIQRPRWTSGRRQAKVMARPRSSQSCKEYQESFIGTGRPVARCSHSSDLKAGSCLQFLHPFL